MTEDSPPLAHFAHRVITIVRDTVYDSLLDIPVTGAGAPPAPTGPRFARNPAMSQPPETVSENQPAPPPSRGSFLKKFLLGVAALVAAFAGYVAIQSPDFRIVRETRVAAPPDKVFPHLVDFRKGDAWSPWSKLDPDMKQTFEGRRADWGRNTRGPATTRSGPAVRRSWK